MGEVYRATDTNLNRQVAIKVLPASVAGDADRLARFQREAEVLAALNHPNIAHIHGLEKADGTIALVMELVEGPTLADRIAQGAIPPADALPIAKQIAEALDAAHQEGIVHRDLKPANIKVRPDGAVKVLDFGLAKAMQPTGATVSSVSMSPTITTHAMTQAGMMLGTAAYMSPEQARGTAVDKRADLWALGVVLFEMLTGKRLFEGATISDTLASVLKTDPDWTALPEQLPASIRRLLRRCLEKDRKRRLDSASAARLEIDDALTAPTADASSPTAVSSAPRRVAPLVLASVLGGALVAALGMWALTRPGLPTVPPLMRFTEDVGAEISLTGLVGPAVAISLDGSRLAYVSRGTDQRTHLSVRRLENPKSTVLAGTEGAEAPFFSPDGSWIGFFAGTTLKKISMDGGAAVTVCDMAGARSWPATATPGAPRGGGFWGEDGNIFFAGQRTPVMRVPASGGTPNPATVLDKQSGEVSHRGAQLLPGGEAFLFQASTENNAWEDATIQVQSVKTGQRTTLVRGGYFGRYIHGTNPAAGHLIYSHGGTLFAAPMHLERLELTGPASPVLEDVVSRNNNGLAQIGFTASGTLVYVAGSITSSESSLFWLDAAGNAEMLNAAPGEYDSPRVSPDGTRIAVVATDGSGRNLAVYEWAQNRMTKLTFSGGNSPVWTPDGKHIVYVVLSGESPGMYWIRSDGGEPQRLTEDRNALPRSFSPDGKRLAYVHLGPDFGIWTLPLDLADPEHPSVPSHLILYN
jgi:serine/threonine-protein kinase